MSAKPAAQSQKTGPSGHKSSSRDASDSKTGRKPNIIAPPGFLYSMYTLIPPSIGNDGIVQRYSAATGGPVGSAGGPTPALVQDVLREAGSPLSQQQLSRFQPHLGTDLSAVRIHSGPVAARSAQAVSATAFTSGSHVVLGESAPPLASSDGQRLLGHELAHVAQQHRGDVPAVSGVRPAGDRFEQQADRLADAMAQAHGLGAAPATLGSSRSATFTTGSIQREDPPATPSPTPPTPPVLTPPTFGTAQWTPYGPSPRFQLQLDPRLMSEIQAMQVVRQILDPQVIQPALAQALAAAPAGGPRITSPGQPPAPSGGGGPAASPATTPSAPTPQTPPSATPGADPTTPRPGTPGDVVGAITQVPEVRAALTQLQTFAVGRISSDWRQLQTGERVALITTGAFIGAGALGGVLSDPTARNQALGLLNGRVLPTLLVPGLGVEINTQQGGLMLGLHLDIGRLLPPSLGFGPGSPTPFGGPPQPQPFAPGAPIQRTMAAPTTSQSGEHYVPSPTQIRDRLESTKSGASQEMLAHSARSGGADGFLESPGDDNIRDNIRVFDNPASWKAAASLGAHGFSHRGDVFLGEGLGSRGAPSRQSVLHHEFVHAQQARMGGAVASTSQLETQADHNSSGVLHHGDLLSANPDEVLGLWWVIPLLAGAYVLLRPNVANAPGPGDVLQPSVSEAQVVGEALALFAVPAGVAGALGRLGYGVIASWGVAGAASSVSYRGVQDVGRGEFSGGEAYVVDATTGAIIGVVVAGVFRPFISAAPSTGSGAPRLVHFSSEAGAEGISTSGVLRGSQGIYTLPESAAGHGPLGRFGRTLVNPANTRSYVTLPESAGGVFRQPVPMGPISAYQRLAGVWRAPAGSINMTTGAFTPSGSSMANLTGQFWPYGVDGLIWVGGATMASLSSPAVPGAYDRGTTGLLRSVFTTGSPPPVTTRSDGPFIIVNDPSSLPMEGMGMDPGFAPNRFPLRSEPEGDRGPAPPAIILVQPLLPPEEEGWHPPMLPQEENPNWHPPMAP